MTDKLGLLSADRNKSPWRRFREGYTPWVFLIGLTVFGPWAYAAATGFPALLFVMSVPLLGHLFLSKGSWKAFAPFMAMTGLLLLLALFRSDLVIMLGQGKAFAAAYGASRRYFEVPIVLWFVIWALIFAARSLKDAQALRVFKWFIYVLAVLSVVQLMEAFTHFGLRRSLSENLFHSRDNMLIVGLSNTNCALLMLLWPLGLVANTRRHSVIFVIAIVAVIAAAVTSDTNAHLLALAASAAVFFAVKYWPRALKRMAPERVAAVLTLVPMLTFPAIILGLMRSGIADKIKTDLLPSWAARIDIWSFAVSRALEKPLWGWGYEASRQFDPMIPNHPHDMALQAWLELGVPGLVLLAAFWFWLFWQMGVKGDRAPAASSGLRDLSDKTPPTAEGSLAARFQPYLMAQATCFLIIGTISYGLWRAWFYCLGAFAIAATILAIKAARESIKLRI